MRGGSNRAPELTTTTSLASSDLLTVYDASANGFPPKAITAENLGLSGTQNQVLAYGADGNPEGRSYVTLSENGNISYATVTGPTPAFSLNETDGATNQKNFEILAANNTLIMRFADDANSATANVIRVTRQAGSHATDEIFFGQSTGRLKFTNAGSIVPLFPGANFGIGQVNAPSQVTTGATNLLTVGTDKQVQLFDFAAGGGAYTYNIDLDATDAFEGALFILNINKAGSANPTIKVRDGSGGSDIISINNGTPQNYYCVFVFDGTNWQRLVCVVNAL